MQEENKGDKIRRVLQLYAKLSDGYVINKAEEAAYYGVTERSITRDIDDIRNFLDEDSERTGIVNNVVYDRMAKGYRLETLYKIRLQNSEVLALCKILLDSRAFTKNEMVSMLDKLITCCVPKVNQKRVKELIQNEEFHYVEPKHGNEFIDLMWDLGQAINESRYIEIDYLRTKDKAIVHRRLQPVAIMFSEYYFYLTAFIEDEEVRKGFDVIDLFAAPEKPFMFDPDDNDLDNYCKTEVEESLLNCIMEKEILRRGNKTDLKALKSKIIKSKLETCVKRDFMEYLEHDGENAIETLRKLIYDFLSAENAIIEAKQCNDIVEWTRTVVDRLNPSLRAYPNKQIDLALALILYEQTLRDASYGSVFCKFTEVYKNEGGVF